MNDTIRKVRHIKVAKREISQENCLWDFAPLQFQEGIPQAVLLHPKAYHTRLEQTSQYTSYNKFQLDSSNYLDKCSLL